MSNMNFRKILDTAALRIRDAEEGSTFPSEKLMIQLLTFDPKNSEMWQVEELRYELASRSQNTFRPAVNVDNDVFEAFDALLQIHQILANLETLFHDT